jgi:hypothetical protein
VIRSPLTTGTVPNRGSDGDAHSSGEQSDGDGNIYMRATRLTRVGANEKRIDMTDLFYVIKQHERDVRVRV